MCALPLSLLHDDDLPHWVIHPQMYGLVQGPHFNVSLDPMSKHSFTRLLTSPGFHLTWLSLVTLISYSSYQVSLAY